MINYEDMNMLNVTYYRDEVVTSSEISQYDKECLVFGPSQTPKGGVMGCIDKCVNGPPIVCPPKARTLCVYSDCLTEDNQLCQFPFRYKGKMYDSCIIIDSTEPWCSLKTDNNRTHIEEATTRGKCGPQCVVNDCPIGFSYLEGNCIYMSARTLHDTPDSVEEAENLCITKGARLYQPRDYYNFDTLLDLEETFLKPGVSHFVGNGLSRLALGAYSEQITPDLILRYNDGTRAYMLEKKFELQGEVITETTDTTTEKACVMLENTGKLALEKCKHDGEFQLGYICEAVQIITLDGPDLAKTCSFPFKKDDTSEEWSYSCVVDDEDRHWCPTELTKEGTVNGDKWGYCEDERAMTYKGSGSGSGGSGMPCVNPFLFERIWYEGCIMHPREELWCPTSTSTELEFNETIGDYGYCTERFGVSAGDECGLNYKRIADKCLRVSPYAETFDEAVAMCKKEGSNLLKIPNVEIITELKEYINILSKTKVYYEPKYSPDVSSYWVGGKAQNLQWSWISDGTNFSAYSNWDGKKENKGCVEYICTDNYALSINERYEWLAEDKAKTKPYICESKCKLGYLWSKGTQKCLKVVESATTFTNAVYDCSKNKARLISIHNCDEIPSLGIDIWKKNGEAQYWLGYFGGGLDSYPSTRLSPKFKNINKRLSSDGYAGLRPPSCPKIDNIGVAEQRKGFLQYNNGDKNDAKIAWTVFNLVEDDTEKGYICEAEDDWSCPDDYMLFQEECYKLMNETKYFSEAIQDCEKEGGYLVEPSTNFHISFVGTMINMSDPGISVWTGFRRNIKNKIDPADSFYHTSSYLETDFPFTDILGTYYTAGLNSFTLPMAWSF